MGNIGNCALVASDGNEFTSQATNLTRNDFYFIKPVGKGGFGKVWKVVRKTDNKIFAMKEMYKARVLAKRSIHSVINERKILSQLKHPFIVNMQYAFQDKDYLYLIMDMHSGGDLRFHISRQRMFSEEQTKFFVACIVHSLSFIHKKLIIHRDIKPENLVFDSRGYLKVTDFGIARIWSQDNSKETSGTPGYMAPEVMCKQNHSVSVDYYAVGVIAYECMLGRRPYNGKGRKEIRDKILAANVQITPDQIPQGWSSESADFINQMIQRKPIKRLGTNGPHEVKSHPWLRDYPWDALANVQLQSPFVPHDLDNFDVQNSNSDWNDENDAHLVHSQELLQRDSVQNLFTNYEYDELKRIIEIQRQQKINNLPPIVCFDNQQFSCGAGPSFSNFFEKYQNCTSACRPAPNRGEFRNYNEMKNMQEIQF